MDNKDSLVKTLNKRISALKMIRKAASFKAKLNIANGIVMSKILYLLALYYPNQAKRSHEASNWKEVGQTRKTTGTNS